MRRSALRLAALFPALLLAGCSQDMSDLRQWINEEKAKPGGRIEPLPEITPYETFVYEAQTLRSPFVPDTPASAQAGAGRGVRPDTTRNREFLEQFSLDTLRMVGTLDLQGSKYALVQTNDGLIHRVQTGNYMGQNDGRIITITDSEIELVEIIPDGIGGYIERPAEVALND